MPLRRLSPLVVLSALSVASLACGSGSLTSPSHSSRNGTATIHGQVLGLSSSGSLRHIDGSSSVGTPGSLVFSENASTTLTVSVNGTNITSNVDGSGQFELDGVPPGDVTLRFSGAGANATITLTNVPANANISITVTLNGNSARLEDREDDEDDEDEDENEVKGMVSNRSGTCPSLTFAVQGVTVQTNASTKFEDGPCSQIVNGTRVEAEGPRQGNTITAKKVEIE